MKQPEYVRGALFASHAHYWELKYGFAYTGSAEFKLNHAFVWRKRRRVAK